MLSCSLDVNLFYNLVTIVRSGSRRASQRAGIDARDLISPLRIMLSTDVTSALIEI